MLRNTRNQRSHVTPNYKDANNIRDKLVAEIAELKSKLDHLDASPKRDNLAVVQTFKEMIYSRNKLLSNLSRQKDERTSYGLDSSLQ